MIALIIWLAFGMLGASIMLAFCQKEYDIIAEDSYTSDLVFSWLLVPGGPIYALIAYAMCKFGKHGLANIFQLKYKNPG